MPTFYLLPEDTRTALMNYLATKPYQEVAEAISALAQLAPASDD